MNCWYLTWNKYNGDGGIERFTDPDKAVERLKKTKCSAKLRFNSQKGEIVGGVDDKKGHDLDDRRCRWVWWYDPDKVQ